MEVSGSVESEQQKPEPEAHESLAREWEIPTDRKSTTSGTSGRVASVDVLRGLTIFLMIFVNDLGPRAPSWMHHIQPSNADGMTLADDKPWLGWSAPVVKMLAHAISQLDPYVGFGDATGSLAAVSMAGCLLGTILRTDSDVATPRDRLAPPGLLVCDRAPAGRGNHRYV